MSEIHRIKCGNVNCYIIENGTNGILVDTGKKEFIDKVIESCKSYQSLAATNILGRIVLSVSLKEFAGRSMPGFKPNVSLHNDDSLSNYGINARIIFHTKRYNDYNNCERRDLL